MPIFEPSQRPEPKSAWTPVSTPIEAMIVAEFAATGRVSTRWFQTLLAGKTGQPPSVGDGAAEPASRASKATAASFTNAPVAARIGRRMARTSDRTWFGAAEPGSRVSAPDLKLANQVRKRTRFECKAF